VKNIKSKSNLVFGTGAAIVTVFGLLSAFVQGLGFIAQRFDHFIGSDISHFDFSLAFGSDYNTPIFIWCIFGGVLGLAYLVNPERAFLAFSSILVTCIGLLIPLETTGFTNGFFSYINVPWIGSYLIFAGLSLMFLSLLKKPLIHRAGLSVLTIWLILYAIYSIFIITNSLPYIFSWGILIPVYSVLWCGILACSLTLMGISYKAVSDMEKVLKEK
jgi:hypothetical protein